VSLIVPLELKLTFLLSNLRFLFSNVRARSQADEPAVFKKDVAFGHAMSQFAEASIHN
jgi:hypothetical protein